MRWSCRHFEPRGGFGFKGLLLGSDLIWRLVAMPLPQPGSIVFRSEGRQGLPEFLDRRKIANPEQLLLERSDGPFSHPVALGLANEGRRADDAETLDLLLEVVRHVVRTMVVPQDQAEGRVGFYAVEVPGDALTDRLQRLPAACAR